MKDYKCIIQHVSNVVDGEYKINVFTSAGFKVFSPHLTYIYRMRIAQLGFLLGFLLFIVSCAPKHVELPSYEGIPIENAISELRNIQSIEAVLSVEYEKNDGTMSGDASLNVSEDKLNLRLYYLGFLAGEVIEDNGIIKSKPKLDKNKSTILIDGLKNSFFWWNIKDYTLQEKEDTYELKNSYRKLLISKKTLLPIQQTIELNDGEELKIFYDMPAKIDSNEFAVTSNEKSDSQQPSVFNSSLVTRHSSLPLWYNSRLKIEFKNYIVKIKVKSYQIVTKPNT